MSAFWSRRVALIAILAFCWMTVPSVQSWAATDAAPDDAKSDDEDAGESADTFSEEELGDLVARIALYPDPLLAQILIASTEPIDVVRAARWTADNEKLDGDERAAALEDEDWDPSVKTLTAFPSVLKTMSDDLEWTETLGDAFVAQSDDVLDAVQVMRAQAQAVGSLQTTEQQEVTVEDEVITIAPAEPEVIYVPQYDPGTVYEPAPPPALAPGAVPAATEAYPPTTVVDNSGYSGGAMLATGVMSFGAGILVNELFDDDDDDWGRHFDWDDGEVFRDGLGREVNVGDVNIDRSVNVDGGAWRPDSKRKAEAQNRVKQKKAKLEGKAPGKQPRAERKAKDASSVQNKLAARGHTRESVKGGVKSTGGQAAARQKASGARGGAFEGKKSAPKVKKDRQRGAASVQKSRGGAGKPKAVKKASSAPKVSKASRASKASKPHAKKTAFSGSHNGKSAKAAKNRGNKSMKAKKGGGKKRRG